MKDKYYYPKRKAEISIQFWQDKENIPNLTITKNITKNRWNRLAGGVILGYELANYDILSDDDHRFLESVFRNYLERREQIWQKNLIENNLLKL